MGSDSLFDSGNIGCSVSRRLMLMWRHQEEALCYASTLYSTLKEEYYPWENLGPKSIKGIYSPAVVIFKHDLDHDCVDLTPEERRVVAVLTVAAPCGPRLSPDRQTFQREEDVECLRGKIRLVYRMAAHNGKEYVVLGKHTQVDQIANGLPDCHIHNILDADQARWAVVPIDAHLARWRRRCDLCYRNQSSKAGSRRSRLLSTAEIRHLAATS